MAFELTLHNEPLPLAHPFRISGYVFEAMPATVVTLRDGAHDGMGEGAGVYYTNDVPDTMLATLASKREAIEAGLTREEARALFDRLVGLANDVGLLAEEYDPIAGRHLGNFPQAFSHVAMVNSAMNLCERAKPARQRAETAMDA